MEKLSLVTHKQGRKVFTTFDKLMEAEEIGALQLQMHVREDINDRQFGAVGIFKDLRGKIVFMGYLAAGQELDPVKPLELRYRISSVPIPEII